MLNVWSGQCCRKEKKEGIDWDREEAAAAIAAETAAAQAAVAAATHYLRAKKLSDKKSNCVLA